MLENEQKIGEVGTFSSILMHFVDIGFFAMERQYFR
jgi:hypothetical protein